MPQSTGFAVRSFTGSHGGTEHYITVQAPANLGFAAQLDHVAGVYAEALQSTGLSRDSAIFRRIYLSDAPNQAALARETRLFSDPDAGPVAVAIVQQPPLPGSKVALLAYHVTADHPIEKQTVSANHMLVRKNGLGHLWSTRLCAYSGTNSSTAEQTRQIFAALTDTLTGQSATLADNCVRTWIYVKDVDVLYLDMVDSRTAFFERHGLNRNTHYIASTGIEGSCAHRFDTVLMDAYSVLGLRQSQVSYLNDYDLLCHTKDYNVTFERGTRVAYADRAHHFISGTASIDATGEVVHVGDVARQAERALTNVAALLKAGDATLDHMTHLLVYLRDPTDYPLVEAYLRERFPTMPMLILRGPVCRPEWLFEVEGIGISANNAPELPAF